VSQRTIVPPNADKIVSSGSHSQSGHSARYANRACWVLYERTNNYERRWACLGENVGPLLPRSFGSDRNWGLRHNRRHKRASWWRKRSANLL